MIADNEATEVIDNQTYGATIDTYEDKVKVGYKLDSVNVPLTITEVEENNVIKVYYVTDEAQKHHVKGEKQTHKATHCRTSRIRHHRNSKTTRTENRRTVARGSAGGWGDGSQMVMRSMVG